MALFDFSKDKDPDRDLDQVLAYLEAALRARSSFLLEAEKKAPIPASLHSIHEDSKTFRLLATERPTIAVGGRLEFLFFLDGLRFGASARVLEAHSEVIQCQLPETIQIMERRRTPRTRMGLKERYPLIAHQAVGEGVGVDGILENLSEGGVRVRVERAMALSTEKRMVAGTTLVPVGQAFKVLRLLQLPRSVGAVELSGKVVYLAYGESGLEMGFGFEKLAAPAASALRAFTATRTTPIPTTLPPKARRKAQVEEAPPEPEPENPPAPTPPPEPPPPAAIDKRAALLRMKKQSRGMVVFAPAGYQVGALRTFLKESGFGRVLVFDQLSSLLEGLRQPNQGALFVDWNKETPEAIELMLLLREAYEDLPPVVLAVRKVDEDSLLAARAAGAAHLMVKPYACDQSFLALLEACFMNVIVP